MPMRPFIAGNWKLNHGPAATKAFFEGFLPLLPAQSRARIAFFPPSISLAAAADALRSREDIGLGVQNVYWEASGAFTGEISAPLASEAGATLALVGHSERRHVFGESDEDVARKAAAVVESGLTAIVCVGETIEEREADHAMTVVERQLGAVLAQVEDAPLERLVVAYEPVWAIGTGRTATPDDAAEMHRHIRQLLARHLPASAEVPILYGGSVKPDNAEALLAAAEVGGLLVGGASLDPDSFAAICQAAG